MTIGMGRHQQRTDKAVDELRRACFCLYAEAPKAVADDIKQKVEAVIKELQEAQQRSEVDAIRLRTDA